MLPSPPTSTLFPYTTLFRSILLLFPDLFHQLRVGGALDDLVELGAVVVDEAQAPDHEDRKSTRLNSSHGYISYAVFCLKKKNTEGGPRLRQTARTSLMPPSF